MDLWIDGSMPDGLDEEIVTKGNLYHCVQELERLAKQLKGNLNRLAEQNMHSIAVQIENMYRDNSR